VATKAAPAVAIAGALVATAPQAHAAVGASPSNMTVAEPVHTDAAVKVVKVVKKDQPADRTYTVRAGDTLSGIAQSSYGNPADWPWLYHVNSSVVSNPNLIYVGQVLKVPSDPPANAASYSYAPKHAAAILASSTSSSSSSSSSTSSSSTSSSSTSSSSTPSTATSSSTALSGTLGCSGLEGLWEAAGGSPGEAFMAAEIAMAESGGQQYAVSPSDDYGYWQINMPSWGPGLATFDPIGNAKAAIQISQDGTNWSPWTTYVTGAYEGQC
jgi:LysM repeat protein